MRHTPVWAVIPAAGVGRRMDSPIPKQYLTLRGKPVIAWSLELLLSHPLVRGGVVALGPGDTWWPDVKPSAFSGRLMTVAGGDERFQSVYNALDRLLETENPDSWVLVHDAVRPCLGREDLDRLLAQGTCSTVGALLAAPVRDTLKRADADGRIASTVPRDSLWHALTPQLFPLGLLHEAVGAVIRQGMPVTDEAQAMELAGHRPLLVEGQGTNLKITRPADLALAESILLALYPEPGTEADHVPNRPGH